MRSKTLCTWLGVFVLLLLVSSATAYEVVLKNGKVVKGTLVSEDADKIVLMDAGGVQIQFKKSNVDQQRTEAANPKGEAPAAPERASQQPSKSTPPSQQRPDSAAPSKSTPPSQQRPDSTAPSKSTPPSQQKPGSAAPSKSGTKEQKPSAATEKSEKKAARVYTQDDLDRLRSEQDLGEGTFGDESGGSQEESSGESFADPALDISGKSEAEYRARAQSLRDHAKQAEEAQQVLSKECAELKQVTVQTHIVVDEKGDALPMKETTERICADAEQAKSIADQARQDLNAFLDEARQAGIPPGWVGAND